MTYAEKVDMLLMRHYGVTLDDCIDLAELPVSPVNGGSLYLTWSPTCVESLRIAFSLAYSKVTFLFG